jgi:hypothetical protein
VLIIAVRSGLLEHRVHERRLAVVNVRDDGYIANLFSLFSHVSPAQMKIFP